MTTSEAADDAPAPDAGTAVRRRRTNYVGLIALALALVGLVLVCVPQVAGYGWPVLGVGLLASIASIWTPGGRWPGIAGVTITVTGAIAGLTVAGLGVMAAAEDEYPDIDFFEIGLGESVEMEVGGSTAMFSPLAAEWTPPAAGELYGELHVDIEWTSVEEPSRMSPGLFTAQGNGTYAGSSASGPTELLRGAEIPAGSTVSTTLVFLLPDGEAAYTVFVHDDETKRFLGSLTISDDELS